MFDWFRKKPRTPAFDDVVWMNEAARLAAIVKAAQSGPCVVVTFFEETTRRVVQALTQAGVKVTELRFGLSARPGEGAGTLVCRAEMIGNVAGPAPEGLKICVAEHHPLPGPNLLLLESVAPLTRAPPVFHTSLDEPIMQVFGGDRIRELMQKMGVKEDEPVEHAMLRKALSNAREKIAAKVTSDQPASSMEEWFRFNLPAGA